MLICAPTNANFWARHCLHVGTKSIESVYEIVQVEYLPVISPLENQKENAVRFAEKVSPHCLIYFCCLLV